MSTAQDNRPIDRYGKLKLALIPCLAAMLGFVLYNQWMPPGAALSAASGPAADVGERVAESASSNGSEVPAAFNHPVTVEDLLICNPFAAPGATQSTVERMGEITSSPDDTEASKDSQAAEIVQRVETLRVGMILQTPQGNVALIKSRVVRPGDWLEEGLRVVRIGPDGVVLQSE